MLYFPPTDNEAKQLRELLVQAERLQHDRIYYFLVSETIFFLAASTVAKEAIVVFIVAGIAIAFLFTFVNLRTYFRILWLIRRLEKVDTLYKEYVSFHELDRLVKLGCFSRLAVRLCRISLSKSQDSRQDPSGPIGYLSTGIILTWWLFLAIVLTWIFFFYRIRWGHFCLSI